MTQFSVRFACLLLPLTACTSVGDTSVTSSIPTTAAGSYQVTTTFGLAGIPPAATTIVSQLALADEPDAPAQFLVDHIVAALPAGEAQTLASDVEPVLVALVETEIDQLAPKFASGLDELATGFETIAYQFATLEQWDIGQSDQAERTLLGVQFAGASGPVEVTYDSLGAPDSIAPMSVSLSATGTLSIAQQSQPFAYGQMLRAGFDLAVIPSVDPGVTDLGTALTDLVDCQALGQTIATDLAGPASVYTGACDVALAAVADEFYAQLATIDETVLSIDASATALGVDVDGDGTMDNIENGVWTGSLVEGALQQPLGAATFFGAR
jgi:hypothetical protein